MLSFNFESSSCTAKEVGRKLDYKEIKGKPRLRYIVRYPVLMTKAFEKVKNEAENIKKVPHILWILPSTVEHIAETIDYFYDVIAKGKWLNSFSKYTRY